MSEERLTAEQQADRELAHTEILSPRTAKVMMGFFVVAISIILPAQLIYEGARKESLQILEFFEEAPSGAHFSAFESAHEEASIFRSAVQPRLQTLVSGLGKFGNAKTVVGREGWLYYEPGISHLAGPDPFAASSLQRRSLHGVRDPDPRPAIAALAEDLAAADIELILLPIPDKATIHPEFLTRRQQNPITDQAVESLKTWAETKGIRVMDMSDALTAERAEAGRAYLPQDTHWTPSGMERVARQVAEAITLEGVEKRWEAEPTEATRVGDLVDMLQLSEKQKLYEPETVPLRQIRDTEGELWRSERGAPVLLLGDSFSNIFHLDEMGWGESAGFAANLAKELGSELDQIAVNGGGSDAVRINLARRSNPLRGVQAVVWQFSARDLSHGSWPVVRLALPQDVEDDVEEDMEEEGIQLQGRIQITAPTPSVSAPYENARGAYLVEVIAAEGPRAPQEGEEILMQAPVMVQRNLRPSARWREGQTINVLVKRGVPEEWDGRELLDETYIFDDRPIYWVLEE